MRILLSCPGSVREVASDHGQWGFVVVFSRSWIHRRVPEVLLIQGYARAGKTAPNSSFPLSMDFQQPERSYQKGDHKHPM